MSDIGSFQSCHFALTFSSDTFKIHYATHTKTPFPVGAGFNMENKEATIHLCGSIKSVTWEMELIIVGWMLLCFLCLIDCHHND